MTAPLVVVGDTFLDTDLVGTVDRLCPDAPVPVVDDPVEQTRPGGAGLAAMLAAGDGREVALVTALSDDQHGERLRELLVRAGVQIVDLGHSGRTAQKVRVCVDGRSLLRLDHGGSGSPGELERALPQGVVLVSDYGGGVAAGAGLRAALDGRRVVWDPHPRGPAPVPNCILVTPSLAEARALCPDDGLSLAATTRRARQLRDSWHATAVSVTLGSAGALLVQGDGPPSLVPAPVVPCVDPCGAGDRYASSAAGLLADGALVSEAVSGAVLSSAWFVASGGAGAVACGQLPPYEQVDVVARTRAAGGTVVATGGCFDLLHAGHVAVLEQARRLGDCLVVCLNSDASVRRLKGPGRPLQDQQDRARVLEALGCVDAVVVFDEDTPVSILQRLRPDVWAKGGDYTDLPEAAVVAQWGGQAVVLPYLAGRSSSALMREAARRA